METTTPEEPPPPTSQPTKPEQEQPDPKRQKMSSTTTTSDDDHQQNPENTLQRKPRYKRRKIAIFFAYCGVGYQGMQKNPGAKTIEGDLEEALFFAGAVPEDERGQHRKFDWARSARTDKGVSAVGQVVSGKFFVDPPGFVERLQSHLSPQIRIFGYKRTTPSFNSKKFCDRRRYVYMIPVFALDPSCHRNRESVMASLGSGEELVKCFECSERGRKVFGAMGNRKLEFKTITTSLDAEAEKNGDVEKVEEGNIVDSGISSNSVVALEEKMVVDSSESKSIDLDGNVENEILIDEKLEEKMVVDSSESKSIHLDGNVENEIVIDEKLEETRVESEDASGNEKLGSEKFCYGDQEKERFNRVLKYYEGTHNFHNFTTRTKAEDPAAQRYILSFNANTVVNVDGIDFIKCEVVGQSFMLHQIRKMIGLAIAIMRNYAPESLIETAFDQKIRITVPMAPEVGLYLDECFFSSYNKRWQDTHEELSMKAYAEEAEEFKLKHIYSHIASTEHKEGAMSLWLHSLNYRNYPDLLYVDNVQKSDENIQNAAENCTSSEVKQDDPVNKTDGLVDNIQNSVDNHASSEVKHDDIVNKADNSADDCTMSEVKPDDVVNNTENSHPTISEVMHDGVVNKTENSPDDHTIPEVKHDGGVSKTENSPDDPTISEVKQDGVVNSDKNLADNCTSSSEVKQGDTTNMEE